MVRSCYLLFFFLAIQGSVVFGSLRNCNTAKCQDPEIRRELERIGWIPTTEVQLIRLCPSTLTSVRCAVETIEECAGKDIVELTNSDDKFAADFAHAIVTSRYLITELCTPGSDLRRDYLSSITCFKELATDPETSIKCRQQGDAMYTAYKQSRQLLDNEIDTEDRESESGCMMMAYALGCFAADLHDKCGEVARKTFVDTVKRFQYLKREECTEENIRNLKTEFLDFLQLEEQRRSVFSSVFDARKKRK